MLDPHYAELLPPRCENDGFCCKNEEFSIKNDGFCVKNATTRSNIVKLQVLKMMNSVFKNDQICIKNGIISYKTDGFCTKNGVIS